jgi:hypothetical protein
MNVYVPFSLDSRMLEAVRVALFHERVKPVCRLMEKETDYYELVKSLWAKREPFIINEHDVIAWPGAIAGIANCSEPWCTFSYRSEAGWISDGLGLVKFNPQELPNIFEHEFDVKRWSNLDVQIARRLQRAGFTPCVHQPAVSNLNPLMWHTSIKLAA